ncbi:MAG: response regulator [Candidatus Omnitrophica bacterium]|nr:response regulator [Candidatus Omnitrophota bacterium]
MKTNGLTLLAVDDELGILKLLKEVFEPRGWTVITTPTGDSVKRILGKNKVDLILLDIKLPDSSGFDILKEIKANTPSTPVIIYTACGYEDDLVKKAIQLGAIGYVSKTVSIRELIEAVDNAGLKYIE